MIYLSTTEIIACYGNCKGYFCPTVLLPFYKEAVIILTNGDLLIKNNSHLVDICTKSLNIMWNCDIIGGERNNGGTYRERYRCRCCGRYNMADQKIIDIVDETIDYSDDSLFNINSWGADLSFRELIMMYENDELIKPELQRKYVWSKEEASKFVDSLLLGLPVPSIFLAKVGDQKLIIDGYQRLMTVYDYVKGTFSGDNSVFKLTNSDAIHRRWRGKTFMQLPKDEQRRIQSTTIHAIIFEQKHPANDSGMYKIFERINTSGRNLKPQEIRNCVYHGALNTALMQANEHPTWRSLWGSAASDSRMSDIEFILRFMTMNALLTKGTDARQISLKKELNLFMSINATTEEEQIEAYISEFKLVSDTIWAALGKNAFRNLTKATEQKPVQKFSPAIHPAIFDAVTVATAQVLRSGNEAAIGNCNETNYRALLNNTSFIDCITVRTTNTEKILRRVELARNTLFGV